MRVAIIHYWLVGMRGGEKVIEALCRMYPQADIYTHVYDPAAVSPTISNRQVRTSFIARLPGATRTYKRYLALMPMALEQLDLRGYDLILSSESGPSKGIIPPAGALHLCYCHSPMRYIWNMFHDYRERSGWADPACDAAGGALSPDVGRCFGFSGPRLRGEFDDRGASPADLLQAGLDSDPSSCGRRRLRIRASLRTWRLLPDGR